MGVIDNAVQWATDIANDDSHWYSQDVRWGPHYDCSSFVITAYQNVGVPVKDNGATYTGDMYNVFISCGFKDVTYITSVSYLTDILRQLKKRAEKSLQAKKHLNFTTHMVFLLTLQ